VGEVYAAASAFQQRAKALTPAHLIERRRAGGCARNRRPGVSYMMSVDDTERVIDLSQSLVVGKVGRLTRGGP
jgi:hypothetical protein